MSHSRPISADDIGEIGRQLFGERWQTPLAKVLGINQRLLRYWLSGELKPSPEDERRLIALVEFAAVENQRRARNLSSSREPAGRRNEWPFRPEDLEIVDRTIVKHRPTGSEIAFYEYPTPPARGDIPGGTISKMGDLDAVDLQRFQVAAWEKMSLLRYGRRTAEANTAVTGERLAERRRRLGLDREAMSGWIGRSVDMLRDVEEGMTTITAWYEDVLERLEGFQRDNPDLFLNARRKLLAGSHVAP